MRTLRLLLDEAEPDSTQAFTKIYPTFIPEAWLASPDVLTYIDRPKAVVPNPCSNPEILIRDLVSIGDLQLAIDLEKETWGADDKDVTPLTLAIAMQAAGAIWLGAFDRGRMIGFAFAIPSLEHGQPNYHSHMLGVDPAYRGSGIGYRLKLAQRQRVLALGIREITWTFDPLRPRNAHLNFSCLGVISNDYRIDFYGPRTSSPLHRNGTDRLWVRWRLSDTRVDARIRGRDSRAETLDTLQHLEPLVLFNGDGRPAVTGLRQALARQRIAIEIPGDMDRMEAEDETRAHEWRLATRHAFTESLQSGFVVTEFVRSVRGQQGPGTYLLEKPQ